MAVELYDYQIAAVKKMRNGCILCGGVGSGKSRTALAYYYLQNGGNPDCLMGVEDYVAMDDPPKDLYIITTARKRDTMEWEGDLSPFLLSVHEDVNLYSNQIVVDSWNNIKKYEDVKDAFFIFDEQRVIGSGAWVKAFLKITKSNQWILLSATPGDTWQDYIPVFIANGFYKNRTEFIREHVVYSRFSKYPKIDRYLNTGRLIRLRNCILVNMDFKRQTVSHHEDIFVRYSIERYKDVGRTRWDDLMMRLADTRYRRMITVNLDITAPLYWWKDFYTYEVGTVANSCSTMHKITAKEFEWSDFSTEHLLNFGMWGEQFTDADAIYAPAKTMGCVISALNGARDRYLDFKSRGSEWTELAKRAWWQMTQLLPSSYNQKWTVMLNYEVLAGIYPMLRNHELDEWVKFCKWIEALPYSDIIIGRVWR